MMNLAATFSPLALAIYGACALALAALTIMSINSQPRAIKVTVKTTVKSTVKNIVKRWRTTRD